MIKIIQGELFGIEDYTFLCSKCRLEFPRSIEFFPAGRCKDKLASYCRKCSNLNDNRYSNNEEVESIAKQFLLIEKTCKECGDKKKLSYYYMSSYTSDGKTKACKKCIDEIFYERHKRQKYLI